VAQRTGTLTSSQSNLVNTRRKSGPLSNTSLLGPQEFPSQTGHRSMQQLLQSAGTLQTDRLTYRQTDIMLREYRSQQPASCAFDAAKTHSNRPKLAETRFTNTTHTYQSSDPMYANTAMYTGQPVYQHSLSWAFESKDKHHHWTAIQTLSACLQLVTKFKIISAVLIMQYVILLSEHNSLFAIWKSSSCQTSDLISDVQYTWQFNNLLIILGLTSIR